MRDLGMRYLNLRYLNMRYLSKQASSCFLVLVEPVWDFAASSWVIADPRITYLFAILRS